MMVRLALFHFSNLRREPDTFLLILLLCRLTLIGGESDDASELQVGIQQEARLDCDLSMVGGAVRWRHNGQEAESNLWDSLTGRLFLHSTRAHHAGLWQCEDTISGRRAQPIRLVVLEAPSALYLVVEGRRLDPGNEFIPVKEKTALEVECVAEGGAPAGAARLGWALRGAALDAAASTGPNRSTASIPQLQRRHHNATLACLLAHPALPATANASIRLDVQYAPSFGISRIPGFGTPLREGISVSLKCDVDSNPPAKPVWKKDEGLPPVPQSEDGYLNFTVIRKEHSGWYKCTTRHVLGEFSSIGYFLSVREEVPEVELETTESQGGGGIVEVALGGAVQLQCPAGAAGCWGRVAAGGRMEPLGAGPSLHLNHVLYQESGQYRCLEPLPPSPSLEHWRAHNVQVSVTGRPMTYPSSKTLRAQAGHKIVMEVELCANPAPTKVVWLADSKVLYPGQASDRVLAHQLTEGSSISCQHAKLSVSEARPLDTGEYSLLVRTPKGVAESVFHVQVTGEWLTTEPPLEPSRAVSTTPLLSLTIVSCFLMYRHFLLSTIVRL
ncbi:MAM domain-containing glycosylphosphatidylinositol anchor protein 1 [Nilaparvata lugens]|uniref:MAM domain-containing glycosylphosphatidylinositol anchor protein 1 n=1 Tax=Nilaparvata lugens TaxID=108931 RepID=UPI00193D5C40|nr:MAM domain-containing glycosylphosphatidylinositol anchor protein 1 [Nilaparvata lugens]